MPQRALASGAKSRPGSRSKPRSGLICPSLALLLFAGCTTPAVMARAVWIGSERDENGARTLFTYGAGEITTSTLSPMATDLEADALPMLVELDPRGRGALVRAVDNGWLHQLGEGKGVVAGYVDLAHARALPLWLPGAIDATNFTALGDALWWFEACPRTLAVVPLAPGLPLTREEHAGASMIAPLRREIGTSLARPALRASCDATQTYGAASAADASLLFVIAAAPGNLQLRAEEGAAIEALRYPGAAGEDAQIEAIQRGQLPAGHHPRRLPAVACAGAGPSCGIAAVDPDGEAASIAVEGGGCRLLRWDAKTGKSECAIADDAPAELRTDLLVAAIDGEHYLFREELTVHRYNWRSGELVSRPLVASLDEAFVRMTADGRAMVVGTTAGPMLRASAEALVVLNIVRNPCPGAQPPIISPSGEYAAWTCAYSETDMVAVDPVEGSDALAAGDVVRVSAAGIERFQGVPMWVLAIDDSGDMLLHSRASTRFSQDFGVPSGSPRNLYVLAGDGELARIDGLEPDPELLVGLPGTRYRWIDARSL